MNTTIDRSTHSIRVITWNVNKRKAYPEHVRYLMDRNPDIIALQEVARTRVDPTAAELAQHGLPHSVSTLHHTPRDLTCDVLIASRWPLTKITLTTTPLAQSLVSARVETPAGRIDIHNVHAPTIGTYGVKKLETLEVIYDALAVHSERHRVLMGDMNLPFAETEAGEVITFGQRIRKDGSVRTVRGHEREDRAERNIMLGLTEFGFRDVYRALHGYGAKGVSWRSNHHNQNPFRLDHMFASQGLVPMEARYLEEVMTPPDRLSDHAAMEVLLAVPSQEGAGSLHRR